MGEMSEMATTFLYEVLPSAVNISPEPLNIGGFLTTQNVRDEPVLKQNNAVSGALWSDKVVYAIAKKIVIAF